MSVATILSKARTMGVRLILIGDKVKLRGPAESIAAIKPELAARKPEIVAYLKRAVNDAAEQSQFPVADGPFIPWCLPMTPVLAAKLLVDLRTIIGKVADIERWPDAHRTRLLDVLRRQPAYTLADDLAYFRQRLDALLAADCAVDTLIRTCGTCAHRAEHGHGVKVPCAMARALNWRHHDWLDMPCEQNDCPMYEQRRQ